MNKVNLRSSETYVLGAFSFQFISACGNEDTATTSAGGETPEPFDPCAHSSGFPHSML
jgi:hypothetical protein